MPKYYCSIKKAPLTLLPLTACLLLLLTACSSTQTISSFSNGDKVAIISPEVVKQKKDFEIRNQEIGEDAAVGAGSGAVAGAAWGLSCGFYALICSPVGALVGAVTGGAAGAGVGMAAGISDEQADQINVKVTAYIDQNNPQQTLIAAVSDRAATKWQLQPLPGANVVVVWFDYFTLKTQRDDQVILAVYANVTVRSGEKESLGPRKFYYESSPTHLKSWLEDDRNFIALRFEDAYTTLAENIVVALSAD